MSPVMQAIQTPGNLVAAVSMAASGNTGFFYDISAYFDANVDVRMTTGAASAATSGVNINYYNVYATTTTATTITGGTTSIVVASATGFAKGQKIAVVNASTNVGELVTVATISGTTITISAPVSSYSGTTNVYLISQTPVLASVIGYNAAATNTTYGLCSKIDCSRYFVSVVNTDATNAVTVEISGCARTGVQ